METSLHRQLKEIYADSGAKTEVPLGPYRIDVVSGSELVEIQHGSLAAIRDKVRRLVTHHRVIVVKPIVVRKRLIKRRTKSGPVVDRRLSPKQGSVLSLFDELVYFTRVFPHHNLCLEVPLVDIEEWRYPGHGRRRRRRHNDYQVEDQKLTRVHKIHHFRTAADLLRILPADKLPTPFHTQHLADALSIDRWVAQRIAYCLRKTGACRQVGKQGNTLLYRHSA
jgi:hypothetical protein